MQVEKVISKKSSSKKSMSPPEPETIPIPTPTPIVESVESVVMEEQTPQYNIDSITTYLNETSDFFSNYSKFFKDTTLTKEDRIKAEASFKKLTKSYTFLQSCYIDNLSKQLSYYEKHFQTKKKGGAKKVVDKSKSSVHKQHVAQPFLLTFMGRNENELISRAEALTAITNYVKNEKVTNPDIIKTEKKGSFKIIGKLEALFQGISETMKTANVPDFNGIPPELKYQQIMQYLKYCFF